MSASAQRFALRDAASHPSLAGMWPAAPAVALLCAIAALDAALGGGGIPNSLLVVPVLALAAFARARAVAVTGAVAVALAVAAGAWDGGTWGETTWTWPLVVVALGSGVASFGALARERNATSLQLARRSAQLAGEVREAEGRLQAILRDMSEAVVVRDAEDRVVYANPAAAELLRVPLEQLLHSPMSESFERLELSHEDGRPVAPDEVPGRRVLRSEPSGRLLMRAVHRDTGDERWLRVTATPLRDDDDVPRMSISVVEDVTAARRGALAQHVLAEAGRRLGASLDVEDSLQGLVEVVVPDLADWCGVDVLGPRRSIELIAVAHRDPAKAALARRLRERDPVDPHGDDTLAAVIRTGRSAIMESVGDEDLVAYATDPEQLELLREMGFGSVMVVPVIAPRGTPLGAMTFVSSSARRFGTEDLPLAEELGRRAGSALENARMYAERSRIAETLQASLLPAPLPDVAGWELAAAYRPASDGDEVGGDFYDVLHTDAGWVVVIGDVGGKGARAAALTALARYTLRAALMLTADAARALAELNRALVALPELSLCSVAVVALGSDGTVSARSAGHPLPVRVTGATIAPLGRPGPMLGAFEDSRDWPEATVRLAPGEELVLLTDGVLDVRGHHGRFGEARLHELLAAGKVPPGLRVAQIEAALEAFASGGLTDDVAVVAIQREQQEGEVQ